MTNENRNTEMKSASPLGDDIDEPFSAKLLAAFAHSIG